MDTSRTCTLFDYNAIAANVKQHGETESRLFLPRATSRQVYKEKVTVKYERTDSIILIKNILHLIRINIFVYIFPDFFLNVKKFYS